MSPLLLLDRIMRDRVASLAVRGEDQEIVPRGLQELRQSGGGEVSVRPGDRGVRLVGDRAGSGDRKGRAAGQADRGAPVGHRVDLAVADLDRAVAEEGDLEA